jgi:hypothetical protein
MLAGAYLAGAKLTGADLTRAYLADADLADADLMGAYLQEIRADVELVLSGAAAEAPALLAALREGRIDGSCYEGECSCLVGTIATARGVDYLTLAPDSNRPAERWFLAIQRGDTPNTSQVSAITETWIQDWIAARVESNT